MARPKSIPADMNSLSPYLICAGALEAIDFYKQAFGAVEQVRLLTPGGQVLHAGLHVGNSLLMLTEEDTSRGAIGPKALGGSPVTVHLMVDDVDAVVDRAVAAGAALTMPPADMFWGDRYGQVVDPFGHRWSIATRLRELTPAEMQDAASKAFAGQPC